MDREKKIDIIEDLLIDFDEMGFAPTTACPDPEAYAKEWKDKLISAFEGYRKQSEGENISQMHPSDEFICEKCGLIIRECCRYEIDEDDGDEICYEFPYRFCPRCEMKVKGE